MTVFILMLFSDVVSEVVSDVVSDVVLQRMRRLQPCLRRAMYYFQVYIIGKTKK